MKSKYFSKLVLPFTVFCIIFRFLELIFSVEYVAGSYLYKRGSYIPILFNIFVCICLLYFFAFYLISSWKLKDKKNESEKKSKLCLISKMGTTEYILFTLSSVFLFLYGIELFQNKIKLDSFDFKSVFSSFTPYILIFILLSIFFIIEFAYSPKKTSENKVISFFSFCPIILYILIIFDIFVKCQGIINNVFTVFELLLLCSLIFTLMSIPKLFLNEKAKYKFLTFSMFSVFLSSIKFCDAVLYLLNSINADKYFTFISHLNNISSVPSLQIANFFLSIALFLTAKKLFKKIKTNEK